MKFGYPCGNLQVSAIENNTSVNENVNAKLWGVEGEFFWSPTTNWQFNLNVGTTHSSIGNNDGTIRQRDWIARAVKQFRSGEGANRDLF